MPELGRDQRVERLGPGAKPGRAAHQSVALDPARQATLLFGGQGASGRLGDTWTWDGNEWTQASTSGPPPRFPSAIVYDAAREKVLLFSGHSVDGNEFIDYEDFWEWDGTSWTEVPFPTEPGGYIALRMWARRSELISGLVMICTKAEADTDEIKARRRAQIENIHNNGLENFVETGAPKRLAPRTVEERPWVLDWIKMMNYTVSAEANAATLEAMAIKEDETATLASIDVPALILSGSHDIFIPKDCPYNLEKGIRNSVHHVIEDTGHVANLENPTAVNARMDEFLKGI